MAEFQEFCGADPGKFTRPYFASKDLGQNGKRFRLLSLGRPVEQGYLAKQAHPQNESAHQCNRS